MPHSTVRCSAGTRYTSVVVCDQPELLVPFSISRHQIRSQELSQKFSPSHFLRLPVFQYLGGCLKSLDNEAQSFRRNIGGNVPPQLKGVLHHHRILCFQPILRFSSGATLKPGVEKVSVPEVVQQHRFPHKWTNCFVSKSELGHVAEEISEKLG